MSLKHITAVEILVVIAIVCIVATAIIAAIKNPNAYHFAPDGKVIYTVEIDGHDYIKSGDTLTHSASCKACSQREKP